MFHEIRMTQKTLGPEPSVNCLNVVMPNLGFQNIRFLGEHVRNMLLEYSKEQPHVFLFTEAPFPKSYVPSREAVESTLKLMQQTLAKHHPESQVVFSVNERYAAEGEDEPTIHHTGYVVSGGQVLSYSKIHLAESDVATLRANEDVMKVMHRISGWTQRGNSAKKAEADVFPSVRLETGHHVEYRVCSDASVDLSKEGESGKPRAHRIVLISGHQLDPAFSSALKERKKAVLVNDTARPRSEGRLLHLPGREHPIDLEDDQGKTGAELLDFLAKEKLRIHLLTAF